jgi:hypothetical protein
MMDGTWVEQASSPTRRSPLKVLRSLWRPSRLLICAVGLVVVLVTLMMLRSLALRSNELDAVRALSLISDEVFATEAPADSIGEMFEADGKLARRLPDSRLLAGGRLMFHHGYLFELVPDGAGQRVLHAWPLAHGETGLGAFSIAAPGQLLGHPNRSARWSGTAAAPSVHFLEAAPESTPGPSAIREIAEDDGWRRVQLSASRGSGM